MNKQNSGTLSSLIQIFSVLVLTFSIIAIMGITIWDRHLLFSEIGKLIGGPEIIPILILSGIAIIFIVTFDQLFGHIITTFSQINLNIFKINQTSKVPINVSRARSTKQNGSNKSV